MKKGFEPPVYPYERLSGMRARADACPGGVVDLSIGDPGDPPPPEVVEALSRSGAERNYPASVGSARYREAAAGWIQRRLGVSVDPARVYACVGTKEFVSTLPHWLRLRRPDRDTVLYPAVSYPSYAMGATLAGCRAVAVPVDENWRLDLSRVDESDAARALCLWVNSPGNPAGQVEDLGAAATWGRAHGVPVFSDECYIEFTWAGGKPVARGGGPFGGGGGSSSGGAAKWATPSESGPASSSGRASTAASPEPSGGGSSSGGASTAANPEPGGGGSGSGGAAKWATPSESGPVSRSEGAGMAATPQPGARQTILKYGSEGVVAVHSLSKRSNLAGLRAGFYAGDAELTRYLSEVRKHVGMLVPGPVQAAAAVAFDDDAHVEAQRNTYRERIELFRTVLGDLGIDTPYPEGGFYLWAPAPDGDAWAFAERLATEGGCLVSPGEFYGAAGTGQVRVALVQPAERLALVAQRLAAG